MSNATSATVSRVNWPGAVRIVRSLYPPVDLFEDVSEPSDWPLLISAEQKTNPRLMETIGNLDLVPAQRRVGGSGASFLMSPFTHVSPDRPSRFSDGAYGVLHAGSAFDVALFETIFHHGRFMSATHEAPGWTSRFREIKLRVKADLHDLRGSDSRFAAALAPNSYRDSQVVGRTLWSADSNGIVYPSQRAPEGDCVGLFYPDLASHPRQGRPLDYHWNGEFVDLYRDGASGNVYRVAV